MTIAETRREGMVQLDVEGRVDTNTSPELQFRLKGAFDRTEDSQLQGRLHEADPCAGFRAEGLRHDWFFPDADH